MLYHIILDYTIHVDVRAGGKKGGKGVTPDSVGESKGKQEEIKRNGNQGYVGVIW